ncbi:MAG: TonB-dependent receptor [Pseudomonadota bacterium]
MQLLKNRISLATVSMLAMMAAAPSQAQDQANLDTVEDEELTQETIVVLGSLVPRPVNEIGSAISVVSDADLEIRQINLVSDVLREVPGVAVSRTGPQGTLTQVRIRGAEGNQTLVFIDGIEANNPIFGEFNFANLVAADAEQIEVLRGAQSALYGSESIGGVIAVTTKSPGEGADFEAEYETGSFETNRFFGAISGGNGAFGLRASGQIYDTSGIDASPTGNEDDGFTNVTASLKGVANPTDWLNIESVVRFVDSEVETDAQEFSFGTVQDADQTSESEDLFAKLDAVGSFLDEALTVRAFLGFTESELVNLTDGDQTGASKGERLDLGLQANGQIERGRSVHGLTLAVEQEYLDFRNESQFLPAPNVQDDEQLSLAAEYTLDFDKRFFAAAAVRQDYNDVFDDAITFRVSGAYLFPNSGTRIHGSWGEGITDPGFNERFGFNPDTFIGNPDLEPERSQGFDIGVEQAFLDGDVIVDVTYFETNLEDEISTSFVQDPDTGNFVSTPVNNPGESDRSGVEVTLSAVLTEALSLDAQYSYLDATGADELTEVRRPQNIASLNINWEGFDDRAAVNLGIDYNGENEDLFFAFADPDAPPRLTLDSFTLVRLAGSFDITEQIEVFARGENILDEDYQEVVGFASPGAAGYIGVRFRN